MPFTNTKENGFETLIVKWLVEQNGYEEGTNDDYNKEYAVDETRLFRFLQDTQPKEMDKLGVILDVLRNYTTIDSWYKIMKTVEDDPMFDKKRAQKKLRAFVEGNPDVIAKKAAIMVEHFHEQVIAKIISQCLRERYEVRSICIDDFNFSFCKGCRTCHSTAKCVQHDDVDKIIENYEWADVIVSVSPSYWADIPGQFKAFIDRCTPWCNTHEPHATLGTGKKGYVVALRTGPSMRECRHIFDTIEHYYVHDY